MESSGNNFIQWGDLKPQDTTMTVTTGNTGGAVQDINFFNGNETTTGTVSTTLGWTGYPYWETYPYHGIWPNPYRRRRADDWHPGVITITADGEEKISITLQEANHLKRAAKKDPKLAKVLKKFEGMIEIEADGLF